MKKEEIGQALFGTSLHKQTQFITPGKQQVGADLCQRIKHKGAVVHIIMGHGQSLASNLLVVI